MDSTATFPIRFDRPSRIPMTVLGAGSGCFTREGEFLDGRRSHGVVISRHDPTRCRRIRPATDGGLSELHGPLGLSVLRGVNYWRGTALVNGAGTGLVEMTLDRAKWVRLGPLRVRMQRLIVSAEDQSGLVTALTPAA